MAVEPFDPASDFLPLLVYFFIILVLLLFIRWFINSAFKVVRHTEVMIIERFGRFRKVLKPGFHVIIPWVDQPRRIHWRYMNVSANGVPAVERVSWDRVDMREHVIDFGRQHVITKDTVSTDIDALLFYQITDPELAVFKIQNLPDAIELLTQTSLRNIIAQMTLDDTFSSREIINSRLKERTTPDVERWGVSISRVEIFNILPPPDIKRAMENQLKEERERRSTVLTADGSRESNVIRSRGEAAQMVLLSEGYRVSRLIRAKGEAAAKIAQARAQAESLDLIRKALTISGISATDYLLTIDYLRALPRLSSGENTRAILVPSVAVDPVEALLKQNMKLVNQIA